MAMDTGHQVISGLGQGICNVDKIRMGRSISIHVTPAEFRRCQHCDILTLRSSDLPCSRFQLSHAGPGARALQDGINHKAHHSGNNEVPDGPQDSQVGL